MSFKVNHGFTPKIAGQGPVTTPSRGVNSRVQQAAQQGLRNAPQHMVTRRANADYSVKVDIHISWGGNDPNGKPASPRVGGGITGNVSDDHGSVGGHVNVNSDGTGDAGIHVETKSDPSKK